MWCDVKRCRHNRDGYCENKDYISIDSNGKCDSINVPSAAEPEHAGKVLKGGYSIGQRLLWHVDDFDTVVPYDVKAVVTEVTPTQVTAKSMYNGNNSDGLTLIIDAWNEDDFREDTSEATPAEKEEIDAMVKHDEDKKRRYRELKDSLFDWGAAYIEEFIGYSQNVGGLSHDEVEYLMDCAYAEMTEEQVEEFYKKFCID